MSQYKVKHERDIFDLLAQLSGGLLSHLTPDAETKWLNLQADVRKWGYTPAEYLFFICFKARALHSDGPAILRIPAKACCNAYKEAFREYKEAREDELRVTVQTMLADMFMRDGIISRPKLILEKSIVPANDVVRLEMVYNWKDSFKEHLQEAINHFEEPAWFQVECNPEYTNFLPEITNHYLNQGKLTHE